jgi:uncharacterized protein (DUF697 family)
MDRGGIDDEEKPVGELFSKLIDEGKAYAKAEIGLAKATAEAKATSAKKPIIVGFAALLFLQSATTVFAVTVALALATLIGPLAGGLIATMIALGIAALLGLWAKKLWDGRA